MLTRPLMGFSYGTSLLFSSDPTLDFSFTVTVPDTSVQYRLVDYTDGSWDWQNARTFLDGGDDGSSLLSAGRKSRSLSLEGLTAGEGGYMMLQVFSVADGALLLCSERLIAVQNDRADVQLDVSCPTDFRQPGFEELPIAVHLNVPAELSVTIYDADGVLIRRLSSSQLTRPSADHVTQLFWDGRDAQGQAVSSGHYTVAAEARVGDRRLKASAGIIVDAM